MNKIETFIFDKFDENCNYVGRGSMPNVFNELFVELLKDVLKRERGYDTLQPKDEMAVPSHSIRSTFTNFGVILKD